LAEPLAKLALVEAFRDALTSLAPPVAAANYTVKPVELAKG
jgi:hypothetical protein